MAALCSFTLTTKCGACCFFPPPKCLHPPYQPINPPPQSNTQATLSKVSFSGFLCHHHPHLLYLLFHSNYFHFPTFTLFPAILLTQVPSRLPIPRITIAMHCLPSPGLHLLLLLPPIWRRPQSVELALSYPQPPAHPSSKPGYYHATPTSMTFLSHMCGSSYIVTISCVVFHFWPIWK